ncbi:hypothetical protein TNCV_3635171 [Trichonephila clavipes]|nr:hypothetical protein TNCV_3635171 [Trichonephila clavipes]
MVQNGVYRKVSALRRRSLVPALQMEEGGAGEDFPNPGLVRIILAERRLLWGGLLLNNRSVAPVWPKQISGYGLRRLYPQKNAPIFPSRRP